MQSPKLSPEAIENHQKATWAFQLLEFCNLPFSHSNRDYLMPFCPFSGNENTMCVKDSFWKWRDALERIQDGSDKNSFSKNWFEGVNFELVDTYLAYIVVWARCLVYIYSFEDLGVKTSFLETI